MKSKATISLNLTEKERKRLRIQKIKKSELLNYSPDEIEVILDVPTKRAKEILALAEFQQIPSIGIKFAEDLVFLGYYHIDDLKDKNGAELLDAYEKKKGYQTDPCVEDQFRLAVDYAQHHDHNKKWWDFTTERKKYRVKNGYPSDRPDKKWTDVE